MEPLLGCVGLLVADNSFWSEHKFTIAYNSPQAQLALRSNNECEIRHHIAIEAKRNAYALQLHLIC